MATPTRNLFYERELDLMGGIKRGPNNDYIEMICGCTTRKHGDAIGTLRISATGRFEIICECTIACNQGKITPVEFVKHSGRQLPQKWASYIWVLVDDEKVRIGKTVLLKYYKHISNEPTVAKAYGRARKFHRDEFIRCSKCGKERRFCLRSKEGCRVYHNAVIAKDWECSDHPCESTTCETEEERQGRKSSRGCKRARSCKGCTACVCFGCIMCRFADCNCRTCVDFMSNAAP